MGKTLEFKQDFSPCEKLALGRKTPSDATIRRHSESDAVERACDTNSFDSSSAFDAFGGPVRLSLLGGLLLTLFQRPMMLISRSPDFHNHNTSTTEPSSCADTSELELEFGYKDRCRKRDTNYGVFLGVRWSR